MTEYCLSCDQKVSEPCDFAECPLAAADRLAKIETVDHPAHYGGADNTYEVIKVLEAWLTPEEFRGFLKGNVIKYLAREQKKVGDDNCARKAAWYQNYLVEWEQHSGAEQRGDTAQVAGKQPRALKGT